MVTFLPNSQYSSSQNAGYTDFDQTQHDAAVQAWWHHVANHVKQFIHVVQVFKRDLPTHEVRSLLTSVEIAKHGIEVIPCPPTLLSTSWHLHNATVDTLTGLRECLSGNCEQAREYIRAAKIELKFLESELAQFGIDM
jgi:hypothetical protein